MRKRTIRIAFVLVIVGGLGCVGWWFYYKSTYNPVAHCHNSSSFFLHSLERYAEDHDGWFPKGGNSPLDSLTQLLKYDDDVHVYTCHAFAGDLDEHYHKTGRFSEDYCCYRYNEGLRSEDPDGLIVVYYFKPTRWTSHHSKGTTLGRQVITTSGDWNFISEAEFQRRQTKTLRYLAERQARAIDIADVQSVLSLQLRVSKTAQGTYRIAASVQNKGKDQTDVRFMQDGVIVSRHFGSGSGHFLVKEGNRMVLRPGENRPLPGWLELTVKDNETNGHVTQRSLSMRSEGSWSWGTGESQGEMDRRSFDSNYFVQGTVWLNVSVGSITNLECIVKSEKLKYLVGDT